MTGFYDRLEDQLVVAGRRRRAQGTVGRAVSGRGRTLAAVAATVVALVVALAIALPAAMPNDSTSEPVAPPPPRPHRRSSSARRATRALPVAALAKVCDALEG
jgi:hypothetical protein